MLIDGSVGCSSYETVVTEIPREVKRGSSLVVLDVLLIRLTGRWNLGGSSEVETVEES